jgi:lipopolysaccharide/colanic/teichoic acid biosynthesis glycosyltransferase
MEAHRHAIDERPVLPGRIVLRAVTIARRLLDLLGATLAILLLAPLILAIALAVRIDSRGPALFRQRRVGRGKRPFTVLKFRTMYTNADEQKHREYVRHLIDGRQPRKSPSGLYKLYGDDRVTRVGRFLRRWSLDELPQLWNVLRGDMSLAGPRPVLAYEVEVYPAWYDERFAVKPGMTGLWQVSGRNERTYEEMVRLDIEYVRRRSLRLDLWILIRTVLVVLGRKGVA